MYKNVRNVNPAILACTCHCKAQWILTLEMTFKHFHLTDIQKSLAHI